MVKLYVEGGGDSASLKSECRRGFSEFLRKAGLEGRLPRIVACGSRENAFDSFCTAVQNNEDAFLLVDSEHTVACEHQEGECECWHPWQHLKQRDGWSKPPKAEDVHCHLMAPTMEAWFLADIECLKSFYGGQFDISRVQHINRNIEYIPKENIYTLLNSATKNCRLPYAKGPHSFRILSLIDPSKVMQSCHWASRLVKILKSTL